MEPDPRELETPGQRLVSRLRRLVSGPRSEGNYVLTRFVVLRLLGLVFVAAFATAVTQLVPLVGAAGITPAGPVDDFFARPTLFYFDISDAALQAVSVVGLVLSILLLLGCESAILLLVLWALYLSIVHVGGRWYAFGWEIQLLETTLLCALLGPLWRVRPLAGDRPPAYLAIVLLRWLAFRIMLGSGLIKLRGDPCWAELTCLESHFETQPIPNPLSFYLHHLPPVVLRAGVVFNHLAELVLPWFVFGPRRLRLLAALGMIAFQLTLIVSGNLSFLNWLTLVPLLACLDDATLRRLVPARLRARLGDLEARPTRAAVVTAASYALVVAWLSLDVVANLAGRRQQMNASFDRLHLVNTYGAFGSISTVRHELQIEGTDAAVPDDTATWRPYQLPCKPGPVDRRPCWISPYHRRLDWLMWFAALDVAGNGTLARETWLFNLLDRLLAGEPTVLSLFADPPQFAGGSPRFVRVEVYRYWFAPRGSADWWQRERLDQLIRPVARDDPELRALLDGE
ncbi:lipase maturation factor family protein [Nannocystis bainbridge]|uniref:Lipase maturation factor family protein n=1 Tax=Nannocystis bainbridge TaxID=2995303 RepID=A0ABT5DYV8_9BACT|nr:lipase maturation factor family protein [Nannocystis bainbridge]MDC0718793.1 lipase maturation factor family protein [Nannocystis bainbridge]